MSSVSSPSARKIAFCRFSLRAATVQGWFTSSRRWNRVRRTNHGTTIGPGHTFIRRDRGKCLHYYFYFIDEALGLCFPAVPTWCPFRALFYLNGHNWLASRLYSANISYDLQDNAFAAIDDSEKAQQLSEMRRRYDFVRQPNCTSTMLSWS
jgi:hypothetical protein